MKVMQSCIAVNYDKMVQKVVKYPRVISIFQLHMHGKMHITTFGVKTDKM